MEITEKKAVSAFLSHLYGNSKDLKIKSQISTTESILNVFKIILSM